MWGSARIRRIIVRILILTAATGGGHRRAASAIEEYLTQNTEHEAITMDALKGVGKLFDKTICDSYLFMARNAPNLFGALYKGTNKENTFSELVPKLSSSFSYLLYHSLQEYSYDAIISTHPFATEMLSYLKGKGKIKVPIISLITDYGLHRAWVAPEVDGYVVASENVVDALVSIGVERSKIHPFGIPVHNVFFSKANREEILEELGFEMDVPTVLFMAGSFGVTGILKLYRDLVETEIPMQIIIITGNNKKLYNVFEKELAENKYENVKTKLVFFTNEVEKYMHASQLLVTKPGGLTVSEALACNLPMAVFDAIPGQEEDNAEFITTHDMGIRLEKDSNFADVIAELLTEKERLNKMRESCTGFDASNSVSNMVELIESLIEANGKETGGTGVKEKEKINA